MTVFNHGMTRLDRLTEACLKGGGPNSGRPLPQVFGRLTCENPLVWSGKHSALATIFGQLVAKMKSNKNADGPADAGMTFFGQFVDHDVTLDATSAIGAAIDPRTIRNIRTPSLDLDCVYGDGPEASPLLYGDLEGHEGYLLFGRKNSHLDLARNDKGTALIGDPRNDENIFVSQVQGAFICLHNILLYQVHTKAPLGKAVMDYAKFATSDDVWSEQVTPEMSPFEMTRLFIRHHYQWLVINDYLPAFVDQAAINAAFYTDLFGATPPIMPVEFSGAAYRFGHATVQQSYKLKAKGGQKDLFAKPGFERRGPEWDLDLGLFFGSKAQKARPVGLSVAEDLFELPFVGSGITFPDGTSIKTKDAKILPLRNILRDRFALHIASGQQVADLLNMKPVPVPKILADKKITKTPLWFYCLQEAEVSKLGKLTGVGGRIVSSVFRNILTQDRNSYFYLPNFAPHPGFESLASVMAFVEQERGTLPHPDELHSGS